MSNCVANVIIDIYFSSYHLHGVEFVVGFGVRVGFKYQFAI